MTTTPVDIVDRPLVIEPNGDRCDARNCGAAAYVYAEYPTGTLAYCGHHGTQYLPRLHQTAIRVHDLRHLISR